MSKYINKRLFINVSLIISFVLLTNGCTANARNVSSPNQVKQLASESNLMDKTVTQKDNSISQNLVYEASEKGIKYKVYTSRSVDTLFIVAALYSNFNGNYLMPNSDQVELFKKSKEYFLPYANHEFVRNFG